MPILAVTLKSIKIENGARLNRKKNDNQLRIEFFPTFVQETMINQGLYASIGVHWPITKEKD